MELKIKIDYNQILRLIYQLPKKEINKLVVTLNSEIKLNKTSQNIKELILKAPTWTETEFQNYSDARNHLNNSRLA